MPNVLQMPARGFVAVIGDHGLLGEGQPRMEHEYANKPPCLMLSSCRVREFCNRDR